MLEAIQPSLAKVGRQNLDRHVTVKPSIARAPDLTHAAFAELGDNRVLSDRVLSDRVLRFVAKSSDETKSFHFTY